MKDQALNLRLITKAVGVMVVEVLGVVMEVMVAMEVVAKIMAVEVAVMPVVVVMVVVVKTIEASHKMISSHKLVYSLVMSSQIRYLRKKCRSLKPILSPRLFISKQSVRFCSLQISHSSALGTSTQKIFCST